MAAQTLSTDDMAEELIQFTRTEAVLREYGERVAELYREGMRRNGHFTMSPDTLINHVDVVVENDHGGGLAVSLLLAEYWKYVEWGTRPHLPPKGALLEWIRLKPVLPHPDDRGRIPTPEQLDDLIRWKIAQEGTTGTEDLEAAMVAANERYLPRIEDAIVEDIGDSTETAVRIMLASHDR